MVITKYDKNNDIRRQFIKHPLLQRKVRISAEQASGSVELAWRRGQHTGIYDAYRTLRRAHPEAAKYLLDKFGMKPNGNIGF